MSLAIGDKAPQFSSIDQDGKTISLSDFKGKKIILFFYPEDDTDGCTKEACNLRDNWSVLKKKGFVVIGVSPDNQKSHRKFADKFNLAFTLLVDTEKKIITILKKVDCYRAEVRFCSFQNSTFTLVLQQKVSTFEGEIMV